MAESEKEKALQTALAQIEKQFGKGAVMKLGQNSSLNVEAIPTGSLSLDIALGIGGVPRGRIVEIYGPESSGKTTVALHIVAEAQKMGGEAVFIDVEHALDPVYAQALGVDIDSLLVSQPDTGEQALEICEALVRSGAIDVVVVDSVAAMTTKAEIEGEMGDSFVGLQARLMSQALRKLTGAISKSNAVCIFINQLREKIGVMYGNPETTPGGRALKFYSSVRLDVRKKDPIKEGGEIMAVFYLRDRYDLLDHGDLWLSETPDRVSRGWDGACNRTMTWVHLREKATGKEFYYFNTHLDHKGVVARREGVKLVVREVQQIAGRKAAVVVGGDLNSTIDDRIFDPLKKFMTPAREKAPVTDRKGTYNGWGQAPNSMVIDHLFVRNMKCLSYRTLDGDYGVPYISDHYPIEIVVRLK